MTMRRRFSDKFKATVALEALRGDRTGFCRKLFQRLGMTVRWTQLCCEGSELFENGGTGLAGFVANFSHCQEGPIAGHIYAARSAMTWKTD